MVAGLKQAEYGIIKGQVISIYAGVSGVGSKALLASAAAIFAGGPFAWIGAALVGTSLFANGLIGKSFLAAGQNASWYMATGGHFSLSLGGSPFSFIVASR